MKSKTEIFISKAKNVHSDTYSYEFVEYKHCQQKVEITCKVHGNFLQTPNEHLNGKGCKLCGNIKRGLKKRLDTEEFIIRAKKRHNDSYDYSKSRYITSLNKIVITCHKHGDFNMYPNAHIAGQGCPKCGLEKCTLAQTYTEEDFISISNLKHGNKYSYENCGYLDSKSKVNVTCPLHGSFSQNASSHLTGCGCPKCAKYGYNPEREGNFYILSDGVTTKVGITHRKVSTRLAKINKSSGKTLKIISEMFFKDGSIPQKIENACLSYLRSKYQPVTEVFDGSTECFINVDLDDLLAFVTPIATKQTESE